MSEAIEYHRFPRGDHCTFPGCPAKRYYIDSGKRICRLGHEQEGFRQVQSDEDDFGTQGKVTRRKREEKEKVQKTAKGKEARVLFVCCWQLVLWKQVHWLIKQRGCPEELEVVVRDLWAVRLRDVKGVGGDDGREGDSEWELGFSSQTEWETGTETEGRESGTEMERRRRKAEMDRGMPKLIDSLSLCYLGILLMRLPIGLGELHRWAVQEEILYFRAVCSDYLIVCMTFLELFISNKFQDQRGPKGYESPTPC
jgi:RNA polymerase I-specific transcription initiation factor RRN7